MSAETADTPILILAKALHASTGRSAQDFPWRMCDRRTREFYIERAESTLQRMQAAGSLSPEPGEGEPSKAELKAARKAVERVMRSRTYDRHAYDDEVFKEGVREIAEAALVAARTTRETKEQGNG